MHNKKVFVPMQLVVTDLGRCPALLLLGQAPTSYVTVWQEFFFTWRELQSVIELEFSYFKFFHEYSYRVTDSIGSYLVTGLTVSNIGNIA
jgi:hypothetical protein